MQSYGGYLPSREDYIRQRIGEQNARDEVDRALMSVGADNKQAGGSTGTGVGAGGGGLATLYGLSKLGGAGSTAASAAAPTTITVGLPSSVGSAAGSASGSTSLASLGLSPTTTAPSAIAPELAPIAHQASALSSYALPAAAALVFANNAYEGGLKNIIRGKGKKRDYTNALIDSNPITAPINIGLRLFGKQSIGKRMTTGKSRDQQTRDASRSSLKDAGLLDDKYLTTLADGTTFNLGLDGKTKYQNVGKNIDGKTSRNAWDVDFSNEVAKGLIPRVGAKVEEILGANASQKQRSDLTGQLINAITSNAKDQATADSNFNSVFKVSAPSGSGDLIPRVGGLPTRSKTKSPGIAKDGTRIAYGRR